MCVCVTQELERLVCGHPALDFEALAQGAKYEGGYTSDTPVVRIHVL